MRSRTSQGVPEWSGGEDLYIGSPVSATGKVSGVIGIVPGPPEGSRGSTGWGHLSRRAPWAEVGGEPSSGGLVRPPWASPAPRVETLGVGAPPLGLEGSRIHALGASLSTCYTSPSRRSLAKPCRDPATSTTTPSCCWISINLSFPLAGSRRRRRRCTVRVLNAEVPSVRHSVIGDLDHGEYDSINHVHWNASARDLQG